MSLDTNIQNYYERAVFDEILLQTNTKHPISEDLNDELVDIACVALNSLPPRYIRHTVDLTFYTSTVEQQEINDKVEKAVKDAIKFVRKNHR